MKEDKIYDFVIEKAKSLESGKSFMKAKDLCGELNNAFGTSISPNRYGIYRILHNAYRVAGPFAKSVAERFMQSAGHAWKK